MQKNLNYLIFNILNYPLRLRKLKKKRKNLNSAKMKTFQLSFKKNQCYAQIKPLIFRVLYIILSHFFSLKKRINVCFSKTYNQNHLQSSENTEKNMGKSSKCKCLQHIYVHFAYLATGIENSALPYFQAITTEKKH